MYWFCESNVKLRVFVDIDAIGPRVRFALHKNFTGVSRSGYSKFYNSSKAILHKWVRCCCALGFSYRTRRPFAMLEWAIDTTGPWVMRMFSRIVCLVGCSIVLSQAALVISLRNWKKMWLSNYASNSRRRSCRSVAEINVGRNVCFFRVCLTYVNLPTDPYSTLEVISYD